MANENAVHILQLHIDGFLKIEAVDITPDGDMVRLIGANGAGKTAILDGIEYLLAGVKTLASEPVKVGKEAANLQATLGYADGTVKYKIERRLTRDERPQLVIKNANGKKIGTSQSFLDDLQTRLAFDPSAFINKMSAREQFDVLKRMAKIGPEMDALDSANQKAYAERTDINRQANDRRSAAAAIVVPDSVPSERVNVAEMLAKLAAANKANQDAEREMARREELRNEADRNVRKIDEYKQQANRDIANNEARANELIWSLERQAAEIRQRIIKTRLDAEQFTERTKSECATSESRLAAYAQKISSELAEAPPVLPPVDTFDLQEQITNADFLNQQILTRERREALLDEAEAMEAASRGLTKAMEERTAKKEALVSAANLPVKGLGFGDGVVTLDGVPFSQASHAQKWAAACGIAMSSEAEIRLVLIRDGSLLDRKTVKLINDMAKARNYHVWMEVVSETATDGIIISEGRVVAEHPKDTQE